MVGNKVHNLCTWLNVNHQKILFIKSNISTCLGFKAFLLADKSSPALEKTLSEGTDAPGTRKYFIASSWGRGDVDYSLLPTPLDFQQEKAEIITFLESKGYKAYFLPKFHPELNLIQRVYLLKVALQLFTTYPPSEK